MEYLRKPCVRVSQRVSFFRSLNKDPKMFGAVFFTCFKG